MGDSNVEKRYKRKRKKPFLQNVKGFGKKGNYGRGSEIDSETYEYFVRILEVYKEGFPSDEEKSLFVNNVFQQIENNEIKYSSNQIGCRLIEMLLPFANNSTLEQFVKAFIEDLRPLCSDSFASHVLQKLVEVTCDKSLKPNADEDFREWCKNSTIKVSKFLLNNLEDFVWDKFGNHIIRTILQSLAQLPVEEKGKKVDVIIHIENKTSEEYEDIVKDYAQRLISWPQFKDFPYAENTSGLLQVLLKALKKIDKSLLKKCIKQLLNDSFACTTESDDKKMNNGKQLADVFSSKPALMLLELCVEVAPRKQFTKIYADCFINNLAYLAKGKETNFSVQKLLNHCNEKAEFEAMFDELADSFREIFDAGHSGVLLALGQSCLTLLAKQSNYVQNIMKCFNCYEPEEKQNSIVVCLCKFRKFQDLTKEDTQNFGQTKFSLHGILIIQHMLGFNKPIKIINSILSLETATLTTLFSHVMGSHIVDSFVKSQYIGEKSREKLLRKMQGTYQELAATKFGSRCFEALWSVANEKTKLNIMKELSYRDNAWANSQHGKLIACKVNLELYKRNVEQWTNSIGKEKKTETMFAKIIEK